MSSAQFSQEAKPSRGRAALPCDAETLVRVALPFRDPARRLWRREGGERREVVDVEAVALDQQLGDAAAVADVPVGLVAEETGGRFRGEGGGTGEVERGFGACELRFDDR